MSSFVHFDKFKKNKALEKNQKKLNFVYFEKSEEMILFITFEIGKML
jgi:hypothetical protein